MKTLSTMVALSILATSNVRADPARWKAMAQECYAISVQKWEQAHGVSCGSCSGLWKEVTGCAAAAVFPQASPQLLDWCLSTTDAKYRERPAAEDRVSPTLACINTGR
jgi:hypothetical protein